MQSNNKFIESFEVSDWEVETPNGWEDISKIHKTIPFEPWLIQLQDGKELVCADTHMLVDPQGNEIPARESLDATIATVNGSSKVVSVDKLHQPAENMYDITLGDDTAHTYYTNGILSHNTTNMLVSADLSCRIIPGLRIATIIPKADQLTTLGYKLKEVEQAYRFYNDSLSKNFKSNLHYKEYGHPGARMSSHRMYYVLTDASKLRSPTFDWLNFDEYQDFDVTLEDVIKATQSRSEFRSITYGGTSKSVDTPLEYKWIESARGLWRMTCPACHYDNYPTLDHGIMEMIRPNGLCCRKCGHKLNVRDGSWDFEAPNMLKLGRWGFHIPQLIVPANTESQSIYMDIYMASQKSDKKSFYEEFLGEATESGTKEITTKDLQNICILGDIGTVQHQAMNSMPPKYIFKVSGCDWGGSDYNAASKTKVSYTAHAIIGVTPDGKFDLLSAKKYAGMDYDDITHCIIKDHRKFNTYAMASDMAGSAVYSNELRKFLDPLKTVYLKYKAQGSFISIPKDSQMFNLYSLHRTDSITSLFLDVKQSRLRAPRWEQSQEFLKDFLVLTRAPYENQSGVMEFHYVKPSTKSDDYLHAINYAVVLAKLILGERLFEDSAKMELFEQYFYKGADMRNVIRNTVAPIVPA